MRKLILIIVLMLASASAFAGESRSLSLASNDVTVASPPAVDRASLNKVAVRLAQAATPIQSDAAPTLPQTTATTQIQTPAPTTTTTTQPATSATTTATTDTQPAAKPAKATTKTTRRESDEHKARRIAARYGVYW